MTQTEKYIWLIDAIYRGKFVTLEEISAMWRDYAGLPVEEKLPRATFNRWKDAIYEQFGIVISCSRVGGYRYYIENPEVIEGDKLKKWILDTLSTGNLITGNISLSNRILVNRIPSGGENLKCIVAAMKDNRTLKLTYRQFDKDSHHVEIDPYCLKLFENRWYVLGAVDGGSVKIYCLDRILEASPTGTHFELPTEFNAEEFFAPYYGVFIGRDRSPFVPERIVIRAYSVHRHYMESLPLHDSQKCVAEGPDFADYEMTVAPTTDLVMKLLSFGSMVEVIEPASFRSTMKAWISEMSALYGD